ncbi:MBL fold metallo-hydrolase [Dokdonella immobilis]|uniref:Metallo-beta-lactamase superfamily protein n=1 Tax=Dokdonella immobilis TaxID=578942 RepID=A0A1I4VTD8_9GAMM|nr:MBL fold metallo-hydrolase [Dokdonella immobilis]SFN04307.1 Metallo-beta-lactamase superfamily protein [Dokdonella immobilis]
MHPTPSRDKPSVNQPLVPGRFDQSTNTNSHVVEDPASKACAIIDPVIDLDCAGGRTSFDHAGRLIRHVADRGLEVDRLFETHVHADHLSAPPYLQQQLGGRIGIGERIVEVQQTIGKVLEEGTEFQRDGSQFDTGGMAAGRKGVGRGSEVRRLAESTNARRTGYHRLVLPDEARGLVRPQ